MGVIGISEVRIRAYVICEMNRPHLYRLSLILPDKSWLVRDECVILFMYLPARANCPREQKTPARYELNGSRDLTIKLAYTI